MCFGVKHSAHMKMQESGNTFYCLTNVAMIIFTIQNHSQDPKQTSKMEMFVYKVLHLRCLLESEIHFFCRHVLHNFYARLARHAICTIYLSEKNFKLLKSYKKVSFQWKKRHVRRTFKNIT